MAEPYGVSYQPAYHHSPGYWLRQPPDVQGYSTRIAQTYRTRGASAALTEWQQLQSDPAFTPEHKRELATKLKPELDEIATDVGRKARQADLPQNGKADTSIHIDDQQEYRSVVTGLDTVLQTAGDVATAQHTAGVILRHTQAAPGGASAAHDGMGHLGDSLRGLTGNDPMLRGAVVFQLSQPSPADPRPGSMLALPMSTRLAASKALLTPVNKVPAHTSNTTARAYTDQTMTSAMASEKVADDLERKFGNTDPQDDQLGWTTYTTRRGVANQDWAKAEQAVAAELRLVYQGNPANRQVLDEAVQGLAQRFKDDAQAQEAVTRALQTVLYETPTQRATNVALNDVNQAAAHLDQLMSQQQNGGVVDSQAIVSARQDYEAKQKILLGAVEYELGEQWQSYARVPVSDTLALAAQGIDRYPADPELSTVIGAALVLKRVTSAASSGNEVQMQMLGAQLPRGVDPNVKRLVMSDGRIANVVQTYVKDSSARVADTYKQHGTVAAAHMLRDVTDPAKHPAVSPQIAALIITESMPTINALLSDVNAKKILGAKGMPSGEQVQVAGPQVVLALSQAVDVAAAGSDWQQKKYDTPEIQQAIEGVAKAIAVRPQRDLIIWGQQEAVKHGYATLALQVAVELGHLNKADVQPTAGGGNGRVFDDFGQQRAYWQNSTLEAINNGLKDLQTNVNSTSQQVITGMAPLLAQGKYSGAMTEEAFGNGMRALADSDPELAKKLKAGHASVDALGLRLVRTSEAVEFYRDALGSTEGYKKVDGSRTELMKNETSTTLLLSSNSASSRMGAQVMRKLLTDDLKNGGTQAQSYGVGAQAIGDFTEFMSETYIIKQLYQQPGPYGSRPVNIPGVPIEVTRAAHLPFYGGVAIWGGGGGLQAALTAYLFENVKIDSPTGDLRKALLLGLVGGFASFHLAQAGMALVRVVPNSFVLPKEWGGTSSSNRVADWIDTKIKALPGKLGSDASWGLYVREGTKRDEWTRLSVEATPGLVKQLVGLMTLATLWDLSGVTDAGFGWQQFPDATTRWTKFGAHAANLTADTMLLRLQVREMTLRHLGKIVMDDPELLKAAQTRAGQEGVALTLRQAGAYALGETGGQAGLVNAGKVKSWAGYSSVLTWLDKASDVKWAQNTQHTFLRGLLLKQVQGKGAWSVRLIGSNPIGWIANLIYMTTTVVNWSYDHNQKINLFERYDKTFLKGAGMDEAHANVLREHGWWTSDSKADGFVKMYVALNGDPEQFLSYVNGLPTDKLNHMLEMLAPVKNAPDELPELGDDYWMLPSNPDDANLRRFNPNLFYNDAEKRWEDRKLGMFYVGNGLWMNEPAQPAYNPMSPYAVAHPRIYRATDHTFRDPTNGQWHSNAPVASQNGLKTWMVENGFELPPG
jgi:hypothetical protein